VADYSGAWVIHIFSLYGGSNCKSSSIDDIVLCAIKDAIPNGKIQKGNVVKDDIYRTKKSITRKDGTRISFDDNACVLINNDGTSVGTRVFDPVAPKILNKGENFLKIASLEMEILLNL